MFTSLPTRQRLQVPEPALQPEATPGKVFMRSELWKVWNQDEVLTEEQVDDDDPLVGFLDFENKNQEEELSSQTQTPSEKPNLSLGDLVDLREAYETDRDFSEAVESKLTHLAELGCESSKEDQLKPTSPVSSVSSMSSDSSEISEGQGEEAEPLGTIHAHDYWDHSHVQPSPLWSPSLFHLPPSYFYGTPICRCTWSEHNSPSEVGVNDEDISKLEEEISQLEEEIPKLEVVMSNLEEEHQEDVFGLIQLV